ncbi:ester cyclase [Muricauda sp. 2012CJ35-5]|uniref:Ester cyclase n=1 Tax=Flagellimonas spongiicola TaxID=2942208 RepID=A0ABT0PNV1_9FLAO|nr:ester cyclase [Allomuricauda spongiicola]MCL6272926.1 ester cyclase [Allomuricauda spongiicola]
MKKLFALCFTVILIAACNQGPVRYTQNSPEIDTVKKLIANYNGKNYDASMYADTSQTVYNSSKVMSPAETMDYHKGNDANYSSRGFTGEDPEYEMVLTDKGQTWVNCWLTWEATLAANGKEVKVPIHLTYRFAEGKIVREYGYWDPTEIVMTLQQLAAEAAMAEEEPVEE